MTSVEIRIKIWDIVEQNHDPIPELSGYDESDYNDVLTNNDVPDYFYSLDDMYDAERILQHCMEPEHQGVCPAGSWGRYKDELVKALYTEPTVDIRPMYSTPAYIRAKAFLRTFGVEV